MIIDTCLVGEDRLMAVILAQWLSTACESLNAEC